MILTFFLNDDNAKMIIRRSYIYFLLIHTDAVKVAKLVKFQISEHTVTVRLHNADNEEENPKAIQVDGLQNKVDEDTLENLFENKMRSRGGPLESVILSPDKKRATLIFENADG